jgi:glycine cleavage system protein P-like pyridoxal-binding family
MKSNDNNFEGFHIALPFPPTDIHADYEMEIYARFMRHLRTVPTSRPDIRILAATQFVADMMHVQDAEVSSVLVDLGLRAPRMAFPEAYLESVDNALMRESHEIGSACSALRELQQHWHSIGEDKFAAFKRCYPILAEGMFVPAPC